MTAKQHSGIRAVIFDIGGVLLRNEDRSGQRKWEARLGLARGELRQVIGNPELSALATIGQIPESAVWQHAADVLGLTAEQLRELQRDFWAGERFDAVLLQFLRALRPRYATAILSNAWSDSRGRLTEAYGLDEFVDTIVFSAEVGLAKPDPRIYHYTADLLHIPPKEAIFVDDMPENVQAARAVGMRGVQFSGTAQTIAEVRRY